MARLEIIKAKKAELQGKSEQVIEEEVEKLESPIAWKILHNFDPKHYPEEMPEGFKAVGVPEGKMSYGFNITMPDGTKTFLKADKRADQIKSGSPIPEKTDLESLSKFAEKLGEIGIPTSKMLRSGERQSFSVTLPIDESLPEELRGCQVIHQSFLTGPVLERNAAIDQSILIGAARTLGQFQRAGAKYASETEDHGIVEDSRNIPGKIDKIPSLITGFLEDIGLRGRDIKEIDESCRQDGADYNVIFKSLLDRNNAYIKTNLNSEDPKLITHIEQVTQLSKAATNGNLAKHINVMATISNRLDELQNLPKGFVHNDSHVGNFILDKGRVNIIDYGEISTKGFLVADFFSLLLHPLVINHQGKMPGDIKVTEDDMKPLLAEYDLARSFSKYDLVGNFSKAVPRLSEKEVNNMFLIYTAESGFHFIIDHIHHVTAAITEFPKESEEGQIKEPQDINDIIDNEVRYVNEVKDKPLGKWLQEVRKKTGEALVDLAIPPPSSELTGVKQSWAERMSSRTEKGSKSKEV